LLCREPRGRRRTMLERFQQSARHHVVEPAPHLRLLELHVRAEVVIAHGAIREESLQQDSLPGILYDPLATGHQLLLYAFRRTTLARRQRDVGDRDNRAHHREREAERELALVSRGVEALQESDAYRIRRRRPRTQSEPAELGLGLCRARLP